MVLRQKMKKVDLESSILKDVFEKDEDTYL